jgi:hypothetical protein
MRSVSFLPFYCGDRFEPSPNLAWVRVFVNMNPNHGGQPQQYHPEYGYPAIPQQMAPYAQVYPDQQTSSSIGWWPQYSQPPEQNAVFTTAHPPQYHQTPVHLN